MYVCLKNSRWQTGGRQRPAKWSPFNHLSPQEGPGSSGGWWGLPKPGDTTWHVWVVCVCVWVSHIISVGLSWEPNQQLELGYGQVGWGSCVW